MSDHHSNTNARYREIYNFYCERLKIHGEYAKLIPRSIIIQEVAKQFHLSCGRTRNILNEQIAKNSQEIIEMT